MLHHYIVRHLHEKLMDAVQAGRDNDAYVYAQLLAHHCKRFSMEAFK